MSAEQQPSPLVALAKHDFVSFGGGLLTLRRGDEIILDPPPQSSLDCHFPPLQAAPSWYVGKRAMDGARGVVYLPSLKFPRATTKDQEAGSSLQGRLWPSEDSVTKKGTAAASRPHKKISGVQEVGFVIVFLLILVILKSRGEAGWELALLGFLPCLLSLLDQLAHLCALFRKWNHAV